MFYFFSLFAFLMIDPILAQLTPLSVWPGTFNTNWMKNIKTCATQSKTNSSKYYVQAFADKLVYLRGNSTCSTASNDCTWTGKFYYPGIEGIRGDFSLTVMGASPNSLTGTLTFSGGISQSVLNITGTKNTAATKPSSEDCFETDVDFIESKKPMFTGTTSDVSYIYFYQVVGGGKYTASWEYLYADGRPAKGIDFGPCFEDMQVCPSTWYEPADVQGLTLAVAKNATANYYHWSIATTVSDYDLTYNYETTDESASAMRFMAPGSEDFAFQQGAINNCMSLDNSDFESDCMKDYSDDSSDDEVLQATLGAAGAATAFSVFTFVAILVLGYFLLYKPTKAPLSSSSTSKKSDEI
jgi:hypothetical protein